MEKTRIKLEDLVALSVVVAFSLGCIATAHRSPRVLDSGEKSAGVNYIMADNLAESGDEPIRLIAVDTRLGLGNNFDLGFMHTWDISKDNEGLYSTAWGDLRYQLTNRYNAVGLTTVTLGYGSGYVYDEDAKYWITSLPISVGFQGRRFMPYLNYRLEYINDEFFPDSDNQPRSTVSIGCEFELDREAISRLALEVGTFNSLLGGKGDDGLILNVGLSINSSRMKY